MKKVWIYIILSIALILSSLYIYIKSVIDSIEFKPFIEEVNLKDLSFNSLNTGKGFIELKVGFDIKFFGLSSISFSDLNLVVYYNNELVAKSSDSQINKNKIVLLNEINNIVYHRFDLRINPNTIALISKIQNNEKYTLDYEISFKKFGLTINYKNKYKQ